MEDIIRVKLPFVTVDQKIFLIKALNYYRNSCVEFSYSSDDVIFNATNLMEMIELQSELLQVEE